MEWINVKDKHFVEINDMPNGGYSWSGIVDEPFMVAIPTNKGWCIQQVVLTDEVGLQCHTDDDGPTYFGWDIKDVTHWIKLENPK